MNISRRVLLKVSLAVWPGLLTPRDAALATEGRDFPGQTFSAVIDTFVPADDRPGALALGIDALLLEAVEANPGYRARLGDVLLHLGRLSRVAHGVAFDALSLADRSHLLERVLRDRTSGDLRAQLMSLRLKTLTRFYTSAQAFEMLEYHPPSQGGYPDYARPPV